MDVRERGEPIGDERGDVPKYHMATCPNCGGRGYIFDSMGNRYDCTQCEASGQVDD
jgi:ribosomal protein S27AE